MLDNEDMALKSTCVGAIGSCAHAAEDAFAPYFQVIMTRLSQLIRTDTLEDDALLLRGIVMDTIGAIAEGVGKESFTPYLNDLMQVSMQGLSLDHARLRECTYCFFGVMARLFEEEFSRYLSGIVPVIINSCKAVEKDFDDNEEGVLLFTLKEE